MNKNEKVLAEFMAYCAEHPELRFWQALRAFADVRFILIAESHDISTDEYNKIQDTFYFEGLTNQPVE